LFAVRAAASLAFITMLALSWVAAAVGTRTYSVGEILRLAKRDQGVSIRGADVLGDVRFPPSVAGPVILDDVTFSGRVDARGTTFGSLVYLRNVTFKSDVNLMGSTFNGPVLFDAKFIKNADFRFTQFDRLSDFGRTTFSRIVDFQDASFSDVANFVGTTFGDPLDSSHSAAEFSNAEFHGGADFESAKFYDAARFDSARFSAAAIFAQSQFESYSNPADFDAARFDAGATFASAMFAGEADFASSSSGGDMSFDGSQFQRAASFQAAVFSGSTSFSNASLSQLLNLDEASLARLELNGLSFEGTQRSVGNAEQARVVIPTSESKLGHVEELVADPGEVNRIGIHEQSTAHVEKEHALELIRAAAQRAGDTNAANRAQLELRTLKRQDENPIVRVLDWVFYWGAAGYFVEVWHPIALLVLLLLITTGFRLARAWPDAKSPGQKLDSGCKSFFASFGALWRLKLHEGTALEMLESTAYKVVLIVLVLNLANVWPPVHDVLQGILP
jgi:hypothetical protein